MSIIFSAGNGHVFKSEKPREEPRILIRYSLRMFAKVLINNKEYYTRANLILKFITRCRENFTTREYAKFRIISCCFRKHVQYLYFSIMHFKWKSSDHSYYINIQHVNMLLMTYWIGLGLFMCIWMGVCVNEWLIRYMACVYINLV